MVLKFKLIISLKKIIARTDQIPNPLPNPRGLEAYGKF